MTIAKRLTALTLVVLLAASPALVLAHDGNGRGNGIGLDLRGDLRAFLNEDKEDRKELKNEIKEERKALKNEIKQERKEIKNALKEEKKEQKEERKEDKGVRAHGNIEAKIDARIAALVALESRVIDSIHLSAEEKAEIRAYISAQLASLRDLAERIDNGADFADIRADFKAAVHVSAGSFLAMPYAALSATADRVLMIVDRMEDLADRLEARIDEAREDSVDVSVSEEAHADLTAHLSDAEVSAHAALALVADVSLGTTDPDVIAENREALREARAHIEDAYHSLKEAREDVKVILDDLDIELTASLEIR